MNIRNVHNTIPLHVALARGAKSCVGLLLSAGANCNVQVFYFFSNLSINVFLNAYVRSFLISYVVRYLVGRDLFLGCCDSVSYGHAG